jgi:peroxiredoxin Q/BCP
MHPGRTTKDEGRAVWLCNVTDAGWRACGYNSPWQLCPPSRKVTMKNTPPAVGEIAPDFKLPDETGKLHKLSSYLGQRVVLYFYPADDTGGCTKQACGFRDAYPEIEEKNAIVIGVSPDGAASHAKFKTKYNLPFILLSDVDHAVMDKYGVWGEKKNYGITSIGVIRSHFVIDEKGRIAEAAVKVRALDSVTKALAAL